ncbi:MAG: tRNA (adenosine(37)-N6)-dimethylallyltransferase MiaA [bacterium]
MIVGPTASGKSDLAVRLAKKFKGEVISADSRQVYNGLDVGTGKIAKKEMLGIPHYLLNVANPKKRFSASDYKNLAEEKIRYIVQKDKLPIVVGGTGFYIDVLTGTSNLPNVPPNKLLREKLEKFDKEKLYQMLKENDPRRAKTIDKYNKVRLIRALEIIDALGRVPLVPLGHPMSKYKWIYIGLKPENISAKIETRLLKRIPGIIKEAKKLHARGLSYKRMHELGLEYRYVALYLQKKLTKQEFVEKLYTEIRRYAKRQMTYWKRNKKIRWFTLSGVEGFTSKEYQKIEKYTKKVL